jgi:hypothetical protein
MTIGELLAYLYPEKALSEAVNWPPDIFALCAAVLQKSGAYTTAVTKWPPQNGKPMSASEWTSFIAGEGSKWRAGVVNKNIPSNIKNWWEIVIQGQTKSLDNLKNERALCDALLQLSAAADEACEGIGLIKKPDDKFDQLVEDMIAKQMNVGKISTLCEGIDTKKLCVLPKLHTPRNGITIRSLSHNLALCHVGEVTPSFVVSPMDIGQKLNLLIVPWSKTVLPADFSVAEKPSNGDYSMPEGFGFFNYKIRSGRRWPDDLFINILACSRETVGEIHGVVFPELAMTSAEEAKAWKQLSTEFSNAFMVTGIGEAVKDGGMGSNQVICRVPLPFPGYSLYKQDKHHRWLLDKGQICQYGLSSLLDKEKCWWENTKLLPREIRFMQLTPWLVMSLLVCEDLARQDPIGDIIRAVGPNLVLCLLMDGPQLANRWSSRYATVLADDPGSSVLTLTSIGMAKLSRCLGKPESRVVALWKDSTAGPHELELPCDAEALVLSLEMDYGTEWSADGRCSKNSAGNWKLAAVHPIRVNEWEKK